MLKATNIKNISYKFLCAVILVLVSPILYANGSNPKDGEELLNTQLKPLAISISEGVLNAKLDSACREHITSRGNVYIENKQECLIEINNQLSIFNDIPELSGHIARLQILKSRYSLGSIK